MSRKILLWFLIVIIIFNTSVYAKFSDVSKNDEILFKAVSKLSELKIITGVSETAFDIKSDVTRAQMATFITRMLNKGEVPDVTDVSIFTDLNDSAYEDAIIWATKKGIISGETKTTFNPDGGIILQDAYVMLVRALEYADKSEHKYPTDYIRRAESAKCKLNENLDKKITYETILSRGDAAILLYNALYAKKYDNSIIMNQVYGEKQIKIVSFNIRCSYKGDNANSFIHRAGFISDKINQEKPDVIAFQEVTSQILDMLKKLLPEYEFVGSGRYENYDGEGLYTAVRKDTCTILGWDFIWLSPTPYTPGSLYEGQGQYPRICIQTLVRHKESGKNMRVFNVHLDNTSKDVCLKQIEATFEYIESYKDRGDYPFVLLGDFNSLPESAVIEKCNNYYGIQEATADVPVTFNNFGEDSRKLDYIYMSDELIENVRSSTVWSDVSSGIYLSDHYPVCCEMWFK